MENDEIPRFTKPKQGNPMKTVTFLDISTFSNFRRQKTKKIKSISKNPSIGLFLNDPETLIFHGDRMLGAGRKVR